MSSLSESAAATDVTVSATLDGGITLSDDTVVAVSLAGTAGSEDYKVSPQLTSVTIRKGFSSGSVKVTVTPLQDEIVEGDETIKVSGTATGPVANGYTVSDAAVTITDDDTAVLSVTGPAASVAEGASAGFTVTLSKEVSKQVQVAWSAAGSGPAAAAGSDLGSTSGSATFAAGSSAGSTRSVSVAAVDDLLSETAEAFTVTLGAVTSDLSGRVSVSATAGSASASISASDPITVQVTGPSTVEEGDTTSNYSVALKPDGVTPTADLTVRWATGGGSATSGDDYTAGSATLTFTAAAAGAQTFTVATVEDSLDEPDETFEVTLSNLSGGGGPAPSLDTARTKVTTTIADDDVPTAPAAPGAPTLTAGNAQLAVSWSAPGDGGAAISAYDLRHSTDGSSWTEVGDVWTSTGGGSLAHTISGLTNGTEYQVQVRAVNSVGDGAWSATAKATPATQAPAAPGAPTLTAGNAQLAVSWSAPGDGGAAISAYDLRHSTDGSSWTEVGDVWTSTGGGSLAHTISGLTNGTEYQVQVRAVNSVGDGAWSATAKATPATQAPAAPGAPTLTAGNAQLAVSWSAPGDGGAAISAYDLRHSTDGSSWTEVGDVWTSTGGGSLAHTISGLTNGTEYQVQVRAVNSVGDGAWSATAKATPATQAPAAPGAPTLTAGNAQLAVSWSAPGDGGAAISAYDLRHSTDGSSWTEVGDVWTSTGGGSLAHTISGLTNGTEYQVQVRAVNSVGDGAWSATAKATPATQAPAAPGAPTLTAGNAQLAVSWSAPGDGGAAISAYDLRHSTDGSSWTEVGDVWTSTGGGSLAHTISGLTNGTEYQVQVRAVNSVGDGAWSATAKATPATQAPAAPGAPTLTAGNAQLAVSWSAPGDGGAAISAYDLRHSTDGSSWTEVGDVWTSTGGGSLAHTISGLTNGTEYQVQVRAVNSVGDGAWSATAKATPATQAPAAPGAPTLTAGNAQLAVSWSAPGDGGAAISAYDLRHSTDGSSWTEVGDVWTSTGGGSLAHTISGLTNGTEYQVQVRAVNSVGDGAWSATAKATPATQAPAAPGAPTLTAGNAQLAVSWSAPGDGGAAISAYDLRHSTDGSSWTEVGDVWTSTGGGSLAHTISGLTNGTEYQVQVRAVNSVGDGAWSATAKATPATQAPAAPGAPTLTAGNAQLAVSWSAPGDGGAAISAYDLRHSTDGSSWTEVGDVWTSTGGGSLAHTISGLTNGTEYQVQVRAVNSVGDGAWSATAKATPATQAPAAPGAPTLTAGNAQLAVSWSAPGDGGAAISAYDLRHSTDGSSWTEVGDVWTSTGGGSLAHTISGLTNGTEYQVQVRAVNSVGDGAWSATAKATPATQAPAAPGAPTLTAGNAQLAVSWSAPGDGGAAISAYDLRHSTDGSSWTEVGDVWTSTGGGSLAHTISGLTNGTEYQVQVRAVNSVGDGAWSATAKATPATQAPAAPGAPTLTAGNAQLAVSWSAPGDGGAAISAYDLRHSTDGSSWTEVGDVWTSTGGGSLAHTISGLTNGTEYQVQVRAVNSVGDGAWSATAKATPATQAPAAPGAPTLTAGNAQLAVSWSAPGDGGAAISAYDLRHSTDGSSWTEVGDVWTSTGGGSLAHTISGLTNGTEYQVQVRAVNSVGDGAWSATAKATPATQAPAAPGAPTLTAGNAQLAVSWSAPGDGGAAISAYDLRHSTDGSSWTEVGDVWTSTGGGSLAHTISGLTNGTEYQVQVRAVNSVGDGAWSATAKATPATQAPAAPGAPTLTAGNAQLAVSWSAPGDGGAAISAYDLRHSTDGSSWTEVGDVWTSTGGGSLAHTISGLTNGTEYQVQVRAVNSVGDGAWSATAKATPATQAPAAPGAPTLTAGNAQLAVSWSAPGDGGAAISAYDLRHSTDGSSWTEVGDVWTSTGGGSLAHTISGLTNGTEYQVQVRAVNSVGDGAWSATAKATPATQAPAAPGAPTLTAGNAQLAVSWSAPGDGGAAISAYDLRHSTDGSSWTEVGDVWTSTGGGSLAHTISGLTNGTEYQVQVRAVNSVGDGAWSATAKATPATQAPAAPGAPTLTAGNAQLAVSWSAPGDGGAAISAYDLRHSTDGSSWTEVGDVWTSTGGGSLAHTISGLTNGTEYQVQVRAVNSVGDGAWSATAKATPATQAPAAPGAPTLTAGNAQLAVSWSAPGDGGAAISAYDLRHSTDGSSWTEVGDVWTSTGGGSLAHTISGLTNGTEYQVQVRAVNSVGDGAWSATAKATPATQAPAAPGAPTLTAGNAQLAVSWSAPGDGGAAISAYDLRHSTDGSSWTEVGDVWTSTGGGSLAHTISGLTNGTEYQVQVRAVNSVGDGAWSATAKATPATQAPAAPGAPTLTAGNAQLAVSWSAPGDGGAAISAYDLRHSTDGSSWTEVGDVWTSTGGGSLAHTISGLTNGTEYQVQVRAVNSVGDGAWSATAKATPATQAPAAPGAPTLTAGNAQLAVSWSAPGDGGAAISAYDLRHSTDGSSWTEVGDVWTSTGGGSLAHTISGLTNGTEYQVQVRAVNSVGDGAWSATAKATPATQAPAAPGAPTLTAGNAQLAVSWSAPGDGGAAISAYDLRHSTDGSSWTEVGDVWTSTGGGSLAHTISGLTNGTEYQVQVRAVNSVGDGAWSATAKATPATQAPAAPGAPTLTAGNAQLAVSWSAPGDGGAAISAYDLRHSTDGSSWTEVGDVWTSTGGGSLAHTISGLTNGTEYQVQVRAVNSVGDGAWSATAKATPATQAPAAPGAPTLTAGNAQLAVSWSAPGDGGAAISAYDLRHSTDGSSWTEVGDVWTSTGGGSLAHTISGLTNGTEYQVQVRAVNSVGDGAWSATAKATPATQAPAAPGAPTLTAGNAQLAVSWSAPGDGGAAISAYDLRHSTDGSSWTEVGDVWTSTGGGSLAHTISGLTNGTEYQVQVRAVNSVGDGAWSATAKATPATQAPAAPGAPTLTAGNAQLAVSWSAPGDGGAAISAYDLRHSTDGSSWTEVGDVWTSTGGGSLAHTISGLTNGTEYQVQVRAVNSVGDGAWSATAKATPATQAPAAPGAPTLTAGNAQLAVSWSAPGDGGAAISAYDLRHSTDGSSWTEVGDVWTSTGGGSLAHTISGLTNGTEYQVQVRAVNSVGDGAWSATAKATPATQAPAAPGAPTLTAGNAQLAVSWSAPGDGGAAISAYDLRHSTDGSSWTEVGDVWTSTGGGSLAHTISGLTNGTEYQVQVRAVNSVGDGAWSATAKATPATQAPAAPGAPTLTAGNAQLAVSWSAPGDGGAAISAYDLRHSTDGSSWTEVGDVWTSTGGGSLAHTISGLTNGTEYQVQVRAVNSVGDGAWSATAKATPATQAPAAPGAPTLTAGNAQLAVSWSAPGDGGAAISAYDLRHSTDGSSWTEVGDVWTSTGGGSLAHTISGLTNGTEYQVQVRAVNSVGDGAWSATAKATPATQAPAAPGAPTLTAGNAQLAVSWSAPGDGGAAISAYDLRHSTDGSSWTEVGDVWTSTGGGSLAHTISGLTNGTEYQVQVRAVNSVGDGAWSATAKATPATQAPAAPGAPTLTAGNAQLAVSWSAPGDGGAAISAYDLRHSTDGSSWTEVGDVWTSTGGGSLAHTISGLTNGTEYQVQVRAVNSVGDGAWSATAKATPATQAPAAPGAPTLTAGNAQLAVSWSAPGDGGAAISAYDLRHSTDGSSWTEVGDVWTSTGGGSLAHTISGLTNGTEYQVQVRAVNSVGDGAWSATAKATPATQAPAAPGAPTLTAGNAQLAVSWSAPGDGGAAISAYDLRHSTDGSSWTEVGDVWTSTGGGSLAHTISGLTNGTEYQVQVRAVNSVGDGAWSATAKATPATQAPANRQLVSAAPGDGGAAITAAAPGDGGVVVEGSEAVFTVTLSDAVAAEVVVAWEVVGGSADASDFSPGSGVVVFEADSPAGATRTVAVTAVEDLFFEPAETFELRLGEVTSELRDRVSVSPTAGLASAVIAANGPAAVAVSGPVSVAEGAEAVFEVWLEPRGAVPSVDVVVEYSTTAGSAGGSAVSGGGFAAGSATSGRDFVAVSGSLVFAAGSSASQTVTVPTVEDSLHEGGEGFVLEVLDPFGVAAAGSAGTVIADDDPAAVAVSLSVSRSSLPETGPAAELTVTATLDGASTRVEDTIVALLLGGPATPGVDYTVSPLASVTIPAGRSSGSASIRITPTQDAVVEGDEAIVVSGSAAQLAVTAATITIVDDDTAPPSVWGSIGKVAVSGPVSVAEGAEAVFEVWLEPRGAVPSVDVVVEYSTTAGSAGGSAVSGGGFAAGSATSGRDFVAVSGSLVFAAGSSASQTVTVPTVEDSLHEGGEGFVLEVLDPFGVAAAGSAGTVIADDDPAAVAVSLSVSRSSLPETGPAAELTVTATLDGASTRVEDTIVALLLGGPATPGVDYTVSPLASVTIPAGRSSGSASIRITPTQDAVVEGDEAIVVSGSAAMLAVGATSIAIVDDDTAHLSVTAPSRGVVEGSEAEFVVALSQAVMAEVLVAWEVVGGSADASDFSPGSGVVVFEADSPAGATRTVAVTAVEDLFFEPAETFELRLGEVTSELSDRVSVLPEAGSASAVIAANGPAAVAVSGPVSVTEGAEAVFEVWLEPRGAVPSVDVVVEYSTAAALAAPRRDFVAVSGSLVFAAGSSASQTVTVPTVEDSLHEGGEGFVLEVLDPFGVAAAGSAGTVIADDDPAAVAVSLSVSRSSLPETGPAAELTVTATLDGASTRVEDTIVALLLGGPATPGVDYTVSPLASVTIPAGRSSGSASIRITPTQDAVVEGDEAIVVSGSAAMLAVGATSIAIVDDDTAHLSVTAPSRGVVEGSEAEFVVALSQAVMAEVVVAWEVVGGSADASDFSPGSGVVVFEADSPAGATRTVAVTVAEDVFFEPAETFELRLGEVTSELSDRVSVSPTEGTAPAAIAANDPMTAPAASAPSLVGDDVTQLSVSGPSGVVEEGSTANFTVTLSDAVAAEVVVAWEVVGGSADASDFSPGSGVVVFEADSPAGATRTVAVTAVEDLFFEPAETFELRLGEVTSELRDRVSVSPTAGLASAVIAANGPAAVAVSGPVSVAEGAEAVFEVWLEPRGAVPSVDVVVEYSTTAGSAGGSAVSGGGFAAGSATSGRDFVAVSGSLVFAAGSSASQTVTVPTVEDSLHEGGEGFVLEVLDPFGVAAAGSAGTVIADDDPAAVAVSLSVSRSSLPETGPAAELTVTATLDGASTRVEDTIVALLLGGPATPGVDYTVSPLASVTIPAGRSSGSASIRITPTQDAVVEGDEAIVVSGSAAMLAVGATSIAIVDDDTAHLSVTAPRCRQPGPRGQSHPQRDSNPCYRRERPAS